jgi:two-component system, sensor histidine kinase and response regulator
VGVHVCVQDTGVGIAADRLERLFKVFSQADSSTTRRFGGSGLGLAICRQIVTLMGGTIGVTSVLGEGSSFWFEVDLIQARQNSSKPDSATVALVPGDFADASLKGLRVLVVEDNLVNQRVALGMLRKLECIALPVSNGIQALDQLESQPFDMVLMDCQMPEMDGYEATRHIRSDPRLRELPVIGLTAHAMSEDLRQCLEVGMDGYLTKPYTLSSLASIMLRHKRQISKPAAQEPLQTVI